MEKLTNEEQIVLKTAYKHNFKKFMSWMIYPILMGIAIFFVPIGFLSRTARRMGEYSTLYDLHGIVAVLIYIAIVIGSFVVIHGIYPFLKYYNDIEDNSKLVKTIKIKEVVALTEDRKEVLKKIGKTYTHKMVFDKNNLAYSIEFFDANNYPKRLEANEMRISIARHSEERLGVKYV